MFFLALTIKLYGKHKHRIVEMYNHEDISSYSLYPSVPPLNSDSPGTMLKHIENQAISVKIIAIYIKNDFH